MEVLTRMCSIIFAEQLLASRKAVAKLAIQQSAHKMVAAAAGVAEVKTGGNGMKITGE